MDGFLFSMLCVVLGIALVALICWAFSKIDRALDQLFAYDDAYLCAIDRANSELRRNRSNTNQRGNDE